ncbi:MAG: amidoligase family protein [Paenibacillaceae bacterium]|nr:amidoligase family protein [Paenibacillaceae bacterium]
MWPLLTDWRNIRFGAEIEFIGGDPERTPLLPGWVMSLDERQIDEAGESSGSELKTPPLLWAERGQIRTMLGRLTRSGATANWSCGLHVHVDLAAWGEPVIAPLLAAALRTQDALQALLQTSADRLIYCPPTTEEMAARYAAVPEQNSLQRQGRPQSHRCGINAAAWFDIGTVEIRYANGSLDYGEIANTVELCLRFVAAVGAGAELPADPVRLAAELGAPPGGYPPALEAPRWYRERMWLEETMLPVLTPHLECFHPGAELLHLFPVASGLLVVAERPDEGTLRLIARPTEAGGWELAEAEAADE